MVKSAKDRIEKYKTNIDPETTIRFLRSQKESMIKKETEYLIKITVIEGKIKGLLQKEGIYPFDFANYLFFGRELYKVTTKYPFKTALSQANILAYKWFCKGLSESILKKIGFLFGLPLDFIPVVTLTGNAEPEDVILNKTFYNIDPKNKLTGILELTGDAQPEDVYKGKTFYTTDPKNILVGTLTRLIIIPYNGKIADITESDTGYHFLDLEVALSESRKIIGGWFRVLRITGTGLFYVYPNEGGGSVNIHVAPAFSGAIIIKDSTQRLKYNLSVANDDFDLFCLGYIVED